MGSVIKMFAAGSGGTQNGAAQIDVPMPGSLIGVQWAVISDLDADAEFFQAQIAFRSTGAFSTNDDRGVITEMMIQASLTTSGVWPNHVDFYTALPDLPIGMGERLFLNLSSSAGVISQVAALLHFSFDIDKVASRRRV